jgi:hypothetical protein
MLCPATEREFSFQESVFRASAGFPSKAQRAREKRRESAMLARQPTDTDGIGVAFWMSMRPFFLAWLSLALFLLVLGGFTA